LHDPSDGNIEVVFRLDLSEERVQRPQLTAFRCSTTPDLLAEALPVFEINMQRFFGFDGLGQAGRRDQQLLRLFFFNRFNPQRRTGVPIRLQLFGFHAHVAKLSKVLIKGRDWYVLSHCGGGD